MPFRVAIALAVILLVVLFGAQNTEAVSLHLFFWQVTLPASVVVVGAFAFGVVVGALLLWTEQRRAHRRQTTPSEELPLKKKASWWW